VAKDTYVNILLSANEVILVQNSEDRLQRSVFHLNQMCTNYSFRISVSETKVMVSTDKNTVKSMIIINDQILQVTYFKYLVCNISCKHDNFTREKLHALQVMCGTLNRVFKSETRIYTKLKFYKVMATPVLLCGRESLVTKQDKSRIQAAEMKLLWKVKCFT
jgi:hypothetical protein